MPVVSIWIHAVWSTKRRAPYLDDSIRQTIFDHMVVNGRKKGIIIDRINGYFDHAHMLFAMKNTQSISEVMHLVKGESSRWINSNRLTSEPFQWQDDYFALSVSKSNLHSVRLYIDGQEKHHKEQTYYAECKAIM